LRNFARKFVRRQARDRENRRRRHAAAFHEVGAGAAVDVDVDEAGCDECSLDLERAGRRLHLYPRPHGGDPPASTEHGTVLEQTVGPDDGAAKEHGAHTARLSQ
jgi:hypothetical protein